MRSSDAEKTRQLIAGPGAALKRGISGLYYKSITIVTIVSDDCKWRHNLEHHLWL